MQGKYLDNEVFKKNGYQTSFIHSSPLQGPRDKETKTDLNAEKKPLLISVLYVSGVSYIRRTCHRLNIMQDHIYYSS